MLSRIFVVISSCFIVCSSCFAAQKYSAPPPEFFQENFFGRPTVIAAGDVITVRFHFNPELNKTIKVRDDGKISLDFFQGVQAAGETPEDLQAKLVNLFSKEYTRPEITVDLDVSAGSSAYITGEVLLPGAKELRGKTTIAMLLAMGQVNQKTAASKSIFLIRSAEKNVYKIYRLDGSFPSGTARSIEAAPGDIIFVPRKKIVQADDLVEQYVRQLLPAAPNVSASILFTPGVSNAISSTVVSH